MLTSSKLAALVLALYALVGLAPAFGHSIVKVPEPAVAAAAWAALLFMVGAAVGAYLFSFGNALDVERQIERLVPGYRIALGILAAVTLYVLVVGPTPPILSAALGESSFDAALLREDALKLSSDRFFVQIYSQTRDVLVPVVFTLSVAMLMHGRRAMPWAWPLLGLAMSMFIGVWSGQKATIINYLVAALICLAPNLPKMLRWTMQAMPVVVLLLAATFLATTSEFFTAAGDDLWIVLEAVLDGFVYRVFEGPLEVTAAYVDAADRGFLVQATDVVPLLRWLDSWPNSVENRIGLEYFYTGIESISANGLAFGYAYVTGGFAGALLGGVLTLGLLALSVRIARASPSLFLAVAYEAYVALLFLDLLNSNFLYYLLKALVIAVLVWALPQWRAALAAMRGGAPAWSRRP